MIKRINNYLLTHHPLIWNTRLVWVAGINLLLHVFFYIGGLSAISVKEIHENYSVWGVGSAGTYTLSFLCGLLVLIAWCIFFLRNNAFKSFYRIGKWYLAKEFAIICFIIFFSSSYFMSFHWGIRTRIRSITGYEQMVKETNVVNTASVYLPYELSPYLLSNSCENKFAPAKKDSGNKTTGVAPPVDSEVIVETDDRGVVTDGNRDYNNGPEPASYRYYCKQEAQIYAENILPVKTISSTNLRWLQQGHKDSVRQSLLNLFAVLDKYHIEYRLNADTVVSNVFSDTAFTVKSTLPHSRYEYVNDHERENKFYIQSYDVTKAINLVDESQLTKANLKDRLQEWMIIGYTTLSLSIFLLVYRRFTRKVFLISIVGTLVWSILIGLLSVSSNNGDGFFVILLFLSLAFVGIGLWLLNQRKSKAVSGTLLAWHAYLAPFIVMLIVALITNYYREQSYHYYSYTEDIMMQKQFPVSYWVKHHISEIFSVNLIAAFCYMALLFNRWAKRWQASPEE